MLTLPLLLVLVAAGPSTNTPPPAPIRPAQVACPAVARPALSITVKNERGQVLADDNSVYTVWGQNNLGIKPQPEPDGRYTLTVNRRWYKPVTIRHIPVQYDECGPVKPTPAVVRLQPPPGAPTIREFRIVNVNSDNLMVAGSWPYFQ